MSTTDDLRAIREQIGITPSTLSLAASMRMLITTLIAERETEGRERYAILAEMTRAETADGPRADGFPANDTTVVRDDGAGKGSTAAKTGHESDAQPVEAPGEGRSEIGPQKGAQSLGGDLREFAAQMGVVRDEFEMRYLAARADALTTERDEARAALKDLAGEHEDVTDELLALDDRAEKAEAERDEARAVLEHGNEALRASGLTVNGMAFVYPLGDAIAALAAERDEARTEAESLRRAAQVTTTSWREHVERADKAEAAVARVRALLDRPLIPSALLRDALDGAGMGERPVSGAGMGERE